MGRFVLYYTEDCHLCEEAKRIIEGVLGAGIDVVDIATDDRLLQLYGVRIPVLRCLSTGEEVGWPFGADAVQRLLCRQGSSAN